MHKNQPHAWVRTAGTPYSFSTCESSGLARADRVSSEEDRRDLGSRPLNKLKARPFLSTCCPPHLAPLNVAGKATEETVENPEQIWRETDRMIAARHQIFEFTRKDMRKFTPRAISLTSKVYKLPVHGKITSYETGRCVQEFPRPRSSHRLSGGTTC